jgi:hypothetical protein
MIAISSALAIPALLLGAESGGKASVLRIGDYIGQLDTMRTELHEHRVAEAQQQARALKGATVETPTGNFGADASLLDDVIENRVGVEGRLALAANELRKSAPPPAAAVDRKLLDRLRKDEDAGKLQAGGEVSQPAISTEPLLERIADAIGKVFEWIGKKLQELFDWLGGMWPKEKVSRGGSAMRTKWVVGSLVVAILIVVAILAWEVIRRSKKNAAAPAAASEPITSAADADPLSRGANEWERYAAQLAAAGRTREAIRAWFHAVLVTCYGAGILHFRKGRTNWEYVGALSPQLPWRADFITLTRRFEGEWYGRSASTREALDEIAAHAQGILDGVHRGVAA